MAGIFISHANSDTPFCEQLRQFIVQQIPDSQIYLDVHDEVPGGEWVRRIQNEIINRPYFIVVLSTLSIHSEWVREETNLALARAVREKRLRRIIPVTVSPDLTLNDVDHLAPLLTTRQILDLSNEAKTEQWEQLIRALTIPLESPDEFARPDIEPDRLNALEFARHQAEEVHDAFEAKNWTEVAALGVQTVQLPGNQQDARLLSESGIAQIRLGNHKEGLELLARAEKLNPLRSNLLHRERAAAEQFAALPVQFVHVLGSSAVVDHDQLFGVEYALDRLQAYLQGSLAGGIVSITGDGGIGKTALAYEVVTRHAVRSGFTRIAWVSAKRRYFLPTGQYYEVGGGELSWYGLLSVIAKQLQLPVAPNTMRIEEELHLRLRELELGERCLIVVDNLETLEDAAGMVRYFCGVSKGKDGEWSHIDPKRRIPGPHKVLITTRDALMGQNKQITLGAAQQMIKEYIIQPLPIKPALDFIRHLGGSDFATASDEVLSPIYQVSEGNPFLIRLIVSHFFVTHRSVTDALHEVQSLTVMGAKLISYLYTGSLEVLQSAFPGKIPDPAVLLMHAFCRAGAGMPMKRSRLREICHRLDDETFTCVLQRACDLSLIRSSGLEQAYSIHSLLREYICGIARIDA